MIETRFCRCIAVPRSFRLAGWTWASCTKAYISMAESGIETEVQRSVLNAVSHRLLPDQGAEAILLGGTDLALAFSERTAKFPLVDCAGLHADAIARLAIA